MKLGIIGGAGLLGSTTAFYAGMSGALTEIKLVDVKENMVMSHVMDMDQALSTLSPTRVVKANYPDLGDCDIILITASLPERNVSNRNEYLQGNLALVRDICENIKRFCKDKIVINATNPIDVFNYVVWKLLLWPKEKILGFSINDSVRFRWAVANVKNVPIASVSAICVGEHGEGQVPLFSDVQIDGMPAALTVVEQASVNSAVSNWFKEYQALNSGRTSGWTSALGLGKMITAIAKDSREVIPCSVILDGKYGQSDVSIGVPVTLGRNGVGHINTFSMSESEQDNFCQAAEKIRGLVASIGF